MTSKKISLTAEDLTSALDALYENWVPEETRDRHDANARREAKQHLLDAVWPGFATLIDIANKRLTTAASFVWNEGYVSGSSRVMRRMSDEPNVEDAANPYADPDTVFVAAKPLRQLMLDIAEVNRANGWVTNDRSFGDDIALIHSEASEAYEEYRAGHGVSERYYSDRGETFTERVNTGSDRPRKPEGVPSELADIVIRVLDTCYRNDIDLDSVLAEKLEHNRTRGHRHGGKVV